MKYVLGFVFNPARTHVLLILKDHPVFLAGKFNGLGGKVNGKEQHLTAMVREFEEEAGFRILHSAWQEVGTLKKQADSIVIFTATADLNQVKVQAKEPVLSIGLNSLHTLRDRLAPGVTWMIELSLDADYLEPVIVKSPRGAGTSMFTGATVKIEEQGGDL